MVHLGFCCLQLIEEKGEKKAGERQEIGDKNQLTEALFLQLLKDA